MSIRQRGGWYASIIACLLCVPIFAQTEGDNIIGKWCLDDRTAIFDFYRTGNEYQARLVPLSKPNLLDVNNPVDSLKKRKLSGSILVHGLVYDAQKHKWDGGKVYNPENGKTYNCNCRLAAQGTQLLFRGYLGVSVLGQTRTWNRMAPGSTGK